jgi:hypothetical protein
MGGIAGIERIGYRGPEYRPQGMEFISMVRVMAYRVVRIRERSGFRWKDIYYKKREKMISTEILVI